MISNDEIGAKISDARNYHDLKMPILHIWGSVLDALMKCGVLNQKLNGIDDKIKVLEAEIAELRRLSTGDLK